MTTETTHVSRLELFAECLLLGVLVAVAALPVVTLPAALAAGCSGVRRIVDHRACGARTFVSDLRAALRTSAPAAVGVVGGGALLGFDALVLLRAPVPGGAAVAVVVAAAGAGALVVLLRAAAQWRPDGPSWVALIRLAASRARADLSGSALLAGALVAVAVLTWQLPALLPLSLGCLVLAGTAVETRADARQR
ncbi:hypothetical protein ACQPZQ_43820 [Pseudonocardia sp. CA-142604]|uniref:hypothetical protein n=1 Tax=Pseudonocardia sp. CA-142604 TaxID=3240024 RepID=UPI003D8D5C09